jgi:pyrimidine-nucleoside phosphorylase
MQPSFVELIASKRDGLTLDAESIQRLVTGLTSGALADYQMTALLMAIYLRGMNDVETVALTEAMLHSGSVLNLDHVAGVKVDKHSTGGVGDKVSLCLAPWVAACGVPVPMVSGRGLGHTGGTLDKLESIPGFRTDLTTADFIRLVGELGTCMIGQTADIAPADKRIYALRDVTATVECIPLIVASILSKKLAEGIDALVLDVKVGRGAFMKTETAARALAEALVRVGSRAGKRVSAILTRMDAPLGVAIGNANEAREAIEVLHGRGPADLVHCTRILAREMLRLAGVASSDASADVLLDAALTSGKALSTFEGLVTAQGGDPTMVRHPERMPIAPVRARIVAERDGYILHADALELGLTAVAMGAGRARADQAVDPAVGLAVHTKPGDRVEKGQILCEVHLRDHQAPADFVPRLQAAFTLSDQPVAAHELVLATIRS